MRRTRNLPNWFSNQHTFAIHSTCLGRNMALEYQLSDPFEGSTRIYGHGCRAGQFTDHEALGSSLGQSLQRLRNQRHQLPQLRSPSAHPHLLRPRAPRSPLASGLLLFRPPRLPDLQLQNSAVAKRATARSRAAPRLAQYRQCLITARVGTQSLELWAFWWILIWKQASRICTRVGVLNNRKPSTGYAQAPSHTVI